ncbi:MAG: primosomal protein N' [Gammaproteobacteria bacterium]|nr:primosomal protein N' [Gammaproteobacteria bacterium]MCP5425697.1 primosomal protein N' [Gammaproteobacteria bacterium]MCP5459728.1 primosomal protein N' [Gammaproteobacteria bacterium]
MDRRILRIAVPSPLYQSFDYLPPLDCPPYRRLQPGVRVRVPFGRRFQVGLLLEVLEESALPPEKLRPALEILDDEPLIPPDLMDLAEWGQRYYHHPPGEVFATVLPILLRQGHASGHSTVMGWRITAAGLALYAEGEPRRASRQRQLLEILAERPSGMTIQQLRQHVVGDQRNLRILWRKGWIETLGDAPSIDRVCEAPLSLNLDQREAVAAIDQALDGFQAFLLDGVTGSGKTEVYLRIVQTVLARGRQALILVPEIGLTPQLLARFQERLNVRLAVLHSALSNKERLVAWQLARNGSAAVVIGTRSAVFTPLCNPGVIIIDEEHDTSFKQQEGFRYHARDLAIVRARQASVPIVLGSATPALESLYNVHNGRYRHLRLPSRVGSSQEPSIEVLDVRHQTLDEGLSTPLIERLQAHLAQPDGQVMLFLNRRGFAPTLICHECGWLSQCRRCDAHLTVHWKKRRMICHHCGLEQSIEVSCPACGSVDLRALGQGTERIEQALKRVFPDLGIARIDRDSTRRKGSLQQLLNDIQQGQRRILIGTQMLAKGHHFPNVTLVGIVDGDQGLFGADFRAGERMAQLIVQVAGRAGRADKLGSVVIQTHHPQHPLLRVLISEGYAAFATAALGERRQALLPPYTWQALLRAEAVSREAPHAFLDEARQLAATLADGIELYGPVPAPMERRAGRYRSQLLVQTDQRGRLHRFLDQWVGRLVTLKATRKVRWSLDVDPQDLF